MSSQPIGPPDVTAMPPSDQDVAAGMQQAAAPAPDMSVQPQMPTQAPQAAPQKPSLWRSVVGGALLGLANSGGATSLGEGLAQGAAGPIKQAHINQQMQLQQQQQANENTRAQTQNAMAQVQLAHAMKQVSLLPADKAEQWATDRADSNEPLRKSGVLSPASETFDDAHEAITKMTELHKLNPSKLYTPEPIKGPEGKIQWQVMESTDAPIQSDVTIPLPDGSSTVLKAGSVTGKQATAFMLAAENQKLSNMSAQSQARLTSAKAQVMKAGAAQTAASAKAAGVAGKPDLLGGTDANGHEVAGTMEELKAAGVANPHKLPALIQTQTEAGRDLTAPDGLYALAKKQIKDLEAAGKLGPVASRWNNFWASKGLDGDQQALRNTLGLIATKLMQAHVGNRGGKDMMNHFATMVPENSTPADMKKALNGEITYAIQLAKRPQVANGK